MEVWNWADCKVAYAVTTYWYGLPGVTSNRGSAPEEATARSAVVPADAKDRRGD